MQSEIEADRTTIDSRETRAPTPSLPDKKLEDPASEDTIFVDWDGPNDPDNPLK
jgi:hypothetical protein